jgi:hypothetical protein
MGEYSTRGKEKIVQNFDIKFWKEEATWYTKTEKYIRVNFKSVIDLDSSGLELRPLLWIC